MRHLLLLLALLSVPAPRLDAQGSKADYERAAALEERAKHAWAGAERRYQWLDDGSAIWTADAGGDGDPEIVLIDAATGERRATEGNASLLDALADRVRLPRWAGPRRSGRGGGAVDLLLMNRRDAPIEVWWVDTEGERRSYGRVDPGGTFRQRTYRRHLWLVTGADGAELGLYRAELPFNLILVDDTPPPPRPRRLDRRNGQNGGTSPDGRLRASIVAHDLVVETVATGERVRLTTGGSQTAPYLPRFFWAPDSRRLVALREMTVETREVSFVEVAPDDRLQPRVHTQAYRKPGDALPERRPVLVDVEARTALEIDRALFRNAWSLSEFRWAPDGRRFTFLFNRRGHEVLRLLAVDAETRAVTTLIEEAPETFVDYAHKSYVHFVEPTDEIVWMSERSGWNHLYLFDRDGQLVRPLTQGEWVVRRVVEVDDDARTILLEVCGIHPDQDPVHVHDARVDLDGHLTVLTEGDGTHEIERSPDGAFFLDTWSRVDHPPVTELRRADDGSLVREIARADAAALLATGARLPERFVAKGRDGETDIWGVLYRPSNHDPSKSYPVVEQIYAGPHGQHVPKSFAPWRKPQALAELGFVVVQIDGMGTNWRSKAFHDVAWKNLGDAGFPDRIAWLRAAAANDASMDLTRVGIYGGSAGGQNALRGLLMHEDFYKVGVADCGCHDNRMDKIWWNELWMSWPIGPHYAEQSNVTQAHRLEGALLLIVGELDRNVDPASTMQVVDALVKADKDFDLLVLPGVGHGAAETPYGNRRRTDFLVRHLMGVEPRWE